MEKVINWFVLLAIIIGVILWFWPKDNPYVDNTNIIDSLQSKIDSITAFKDSIDQRIDTVTITIEKTYIQYEKDRNNIIDNTTNEDYLFFLNYIRSNSARLDSINNL